MCGYMLVALTSYTCQRSNEQVDIEVPKDYTPTQAYPVIFVFPGIGGWMPEIRDIHSGSKAIIVRMYGSQTMEGGFEQTLKRCENQLFSITNNLHQRYFVDSAKSILVGYSLGGDVTFAVAQRHPLTFRRIMILSSRCTYRMEPVPVGIEGQRYFFLMGDNDVRLPQQQQACAYVDSCGAQTEQCIVPGLGHTAVPSTYIEQGLEMMNKP